MLIFIKALFRFLISVECFSVSKIIYFVDLSLENITSFVQLVITLIYRLLSIVQINVILFTPGWYFLFELGSSLFLD